MNLNQIDIKNFILALFKRDDDERFLLGAGAYEFNDKLQHFQPNIIANDIVEKQGTDGQLLAGQVLRSATQSFDGYIGDATMTRIDTETARRAFLRFFQTNHHYKVIYIMPDGSAIQRQGGYLTEAPSAPENDQRFPEYHVGLQFEDVHYYSYAEDDQGDETYASIWSIDPSGVLTGGLVWDNIGVEWGPQGATLNALKGAIEQEAGTPTPTTPKAINVVTGTQTIAIAGTNYTLTLGSIELAKLTNAIDKIYKSGGDWILRKETVSAILLSTGWNTGAWNAQKRIYASASGIFGVGLATPASNSQLGNIKSDHFTTITMDDLLAGNANGAGLSTSGYFSIREDSFASAADLQTAIGDANIKAYGKRASASETTITDAGLIAELDAIEEALDADGNATITPSGTNLAVILDATPNDQGGAVWEAEGGTSYQTVTNAGLATASPIWEVDGEAEAPSITNVTTGQTLTFTGTVPNGQTLIVDCGNQTASIAGVDVKNQMTGQWLTIQPGANTIGYTGAGVNGACSLKWNEVIE